MLDPKLQAEMDQAAEAAGEMFPPMLRKFFLGLMKEGFTEIQALELTKTFLQTFNSRSA